MPDVDLTAPEAAPPHPPRRKTLTERVDEALNHILHGEKVEAIINKLNSTERGLFDQLVKEARQGNFNLLQELWRVDYVKKPPSIKEFIEDDYWLGATMMPSDDNPGLYPTWREILIRDFDLDSRIHHTVLTGALGTGKSWVASAIFLYRIAIARMLRNPQNFFSVSAGSRIYYSLLSLSRSVVRDTVFDDVINFMARSPFFLEECHFNPDQKYSNNRIPLGNDIVINAGSKGWHVIGRNVMAVLLDEGNWRLEANPDEKAYQLFIEVRARIRNRFQKIAGYLPAISLLASSARDETSFTEQIIKEIEQANDTSTQVVYRKSVYTAKKHLLRLQDRWFKVAYGLKNIEPFVLRGWYDADGKPIGDETHEEPPKDALVEFVPEDYLENFARNCREALMAFSGISAGGTHRLFPSTVTIERAIELGTRDGLVSPNKLELIPISMDDDKNVWDYLDHSKFLIRRHSQYVPLRHPDQLRFAHVDLATVSMAGVSISHLVGQQLVKDIRDGEPFEEFRLVVEYDFILTIVGGKNKPISLEKVQRFFFWLRDICHYRFGLVTADQYQSDMPLQMMETRGFTVKKLSVDRSKAPYYLWRMGFTEGRIRMYRQEQLLREAEKLIDGDKKIDHPPNGSKDTSDSSAGSYYNTITATDQVPSTIHPSQATLYPQHEPLEDEGPLIEIPMQVPIETEGHVFDA